jgi:hypothetical protein
MPPSFMVDRYKLKFNEVLYEDVTSKGHTVKGYVTYGEVLTIINRELHDYVKKKWKEQSPDRYKGYMQWPPRLAIVERSVVENDVGLKLKKWIGYKNEIDRVGFPGRLELAHYWVEEVMNAFSKGDHVISYVKEHQESHPVRGYTWNQLLKFDLLDKLFDFTKEVVKEWYDRFLEPGNWCLDSTSFNIGMRARSPDDIVFDYHIPFRLTRGRQIGYNPGPSSVNAFVPHEKSISIMKKIFEIYENEIGCKIYCPKIDGGVIYSKIREDYLNGKKIVHYDVSGMELITPAIINGSPRDFPFGLGMVIGRRGEAPELLSGVGPTSDWDMIAHLELLKRILIKPPEYIVILGDDATLVGDFKLLNTLLYERQEADDKTVRTLGLTCNEYMHPIGRNITVDTADKRINVETDQIVINKMPINERRDIADYFTGWIRGTPLHDIIGKIKPISGVYSPREMVERELGIEATT